MSPADTEIEIEQKLQNNLDKGYVGIFSEVPDSEYHKIQCILKNFFSNSKNIKFFKCSKRAQEISREEELHMQISMYHTKESIYSGINEAIYSLKDKIYFPKL